MRYESRYMAEVDPIHGGGECEDILKKIPFVTLMNIASKNAIIHHIE